MCREREAIPWFLDPIADPASLRQRAWRYGRDEETGEMSWTFRAMNAIAEVVEELRGDHNGDKHNG